MGSLWHLAGLICRAAEGRETTSRPTSCCLVLVHLHCGSVTYNVGTLSLLSVCALCYLAANCCELSSTWLRGWSQQWICQSASQLRLASLIPHGTSQQYLPALASFLPCDIWGIWVLRMGLAWTTSWPQVGCHSSKQCCSLVVAAWILVLCACTQQRPQEQSVGKPPHCHFHLRVCFCCSFT